MAFKLPQINFGGYYNEPDVNPIDVALKLLGHEAGLKSEAEQRGFEREKFQSEQQRALEQLGIQKGTLEEAKLSGADKRRLDELTSQRQGKQQEADITQKQYEDETNRKKLITDALDKVATIPATSWTPELRAMLGAVPELKGPLEQAGHEREMETWKPQLQAAYATKGADPRKQAIAKLYSQMPEYVRQNAPWQDLNALIPEEKPGFFSRFSRGGGAPTTPTPQSAEYVPEWQAGGGAASEYRPEWQAPQAPPPTPQTQPTASQPAPPTSALPSDAFPSVEDMIARSQYRNPLPTTPLVQPDVPPEYQPANQVNPAVYAQRGPQQMAPGLNMPRGNEPSMPDPRQQGFVDWLMSLIGNVQQQNASAAQEMPFTYGGMPMPASQPLPTPYPQPGLQDILRQ